ncbi:hypothetical protein HRE53_27205 (plasmid) [Acaryochloris sp. 'Moss Beach']|uniref:hypothetical protein n=1 Tax=Acaryochloris sp. 'Moss Beach' TaxID=2740837 RepID=UPI001F305C5F|nr:hypothetical protein [Acaryochloris sp. 'Moss Beach']UJB72290.1 hypothetical protein HRE53_27205 [Acaryochloris sp. 'Moss Beach']
MSQQPESPQWQPIRVMQECIPMVDGMLEEVQSQHNNMLEAQKKPHTMDDATIQRVIDVYSEQHEFLWVYREQFSRWKQESPTPQQLKDINRLEQQVDKIDQVLTGILKIADDIKGKTIDSILGKSDMELAMDVLTGNLKLPE